MLVKRSATVVSEEKIYEAFILSSSSKCWYEQEMNKSGLHEIRMILKDSSLTTFKYWYFNLELKFISVGSGKIVSSPCVIEKKFQVELFVI